jgi:transposase-like protein
MLVADGAQGIWKAFSAAFPRAKQQRCWVHKMRNVEDKLPEKHRSTNSPGGTPRPPGVCAKMSAA